MDQRIPVPEAAPAPDGVAIPVRPTFVREGPSLFWLAFWRACLTILTLGLYRFWLATRLRRYYWSSIRLLGDPFEYTGTGLEKLVGFLLAVIILAVYLTIMNIVFVFVGLYSVDDIVALQIAINLSVIASLPLIYFATYRAMRYVLARTRWRGIRFGMQQAAWGYAGRAVLLTLLTFVTLGLLYPYQHYRLTKFTTDRTWFGDLQFTQGGRWSVLMGYWSWVYIGIAVSAGAIVAIALDPENEQTAAIAAIVLMIGYFGIYLAMLRYRVAAFRFFWDNRTLGQTRFRNRLDTGEVIGVTIAGSSAIIFAAFFIGLIAIMIAGAIWFSIIGSDQFDLMVKEMENKQASGQTAWQLLVFLGIGYLTAVPATIAFTQIFMRRPILRRQVEGMRIAQADALALVRQRSHDDAVDAGGFADALGVDIGSGL